jgi:DNA-directed RNA polymerase subunit H (RpoH/RPB5)
MLLIVMSVNVEYSSKEVAGIVLHNAFLMLVRRKNFNKIDKIFEELKPTFIEKGQVDFKDDNNNKFSIMLSTGKLASVGQDPELDSYLKTNLDVHKIVIMREPSKKVIKQIMTEYPNAESFIEHELMEDIPSKIYIPEHQLLSDEEKKNLLETFKENELAKINDTDVMSRYFAAKVGDIFRIIRPSITAGKNIFYRRVVTGNINQLFDS